MKQIKSIIAITIFSLLSFTSVMARSSNDTVNNLPIELKFLGTFKTQHIFQLNFTSSNKEAEYYVSVTDENGYVFCNERVNANTGKKQFSVNSDVLEESIVTFTVTEKKTGKKISFNVNRQTSVSEQMNVVKL